MERKYINLAKEKIKNLTDEEKKQRLIYLKKMAEGILQGPLTDSNYYNETNLKYFKDEDIIDDFPKMGMFEYLCEQNRNNMEQIAMDYIGTKITYRELIENIEKIRNVLKNHGIKKGDIISAGLPFIPETIYLIYAVESLGCSINMCDPRVSPNKFNDYIRNTKPSSKVLFTLDLVKPKIDKIINASTLEQVIFISPATSLSPIKKNLKKAIDTISGKRKRLDNNKYINWEEYVKLDKATIEEQNVIDEKETAITIYTSGTSGAPKGANISRHAFNALAHQLDVSIPLKTGEKFLLIMPPFIAYGLAIGLHGQLCCGQTLIMVPNFNIQNSKKLLPELVKKYKPQTIMGVPTFVRDLISNKQMQKMDFSFLKRFIVGGDTCPRSIEEDGNEFFKNHNCSAKVEKGWGLTEASSSVTFTTDGSNELGKVGVANIGNKIVVLKTDGDPTKLIENIDDLEEASYNEEGEIFASAESQMNGYIDESKNTNVFYKSKDGRTYIRTQDLGYIDQNGNLQISGREKDIVIRPDGHNISSAAIEIIACANPYVEKCAVVGRPAEGYEVGAWAVAYIELKKEYQDKNLESTVENQIREEMKNNLPPRDVAEYFEFLPSLPLTDIGKVDRKLLSAMELSKKNEMKRR